MALLACKPALAQVTQTDAAKTPLPQPVTTAELELINTSWSWNANTQVNRDPQGNALNPTVKYGDFYAPPAYPQFVTGDAINLSGLFKWRKETIDPVKDAKTGSLHFSGKCSISAELLLMGGSCQAKFGWYNVVDPTSKTPPAAAEIYTLIARPQDALNCVQIDGKTPKADGFCPLAWDNRGPYDLATPRWTPTSFSLGDLSQDPRYKGGEIGFAFIGGDSQKCPQNKYSMYEYNQRNAAGEPWVTTLLYQSTVDPNGVYLAFEDMPMSPEDWKKPGINLSAGADGDFNDYVVYVSRTGCPDDGPSGAGGSAGANESGGAGGSEDEAAAHGGTASTAAAGASAADAGEESTAPTSSGGAAGEDESSSTGGTHALGGASTGGVASNAPPQKSSSCGYAALASERFPGAWPVLGFVLGLAAARRRRARATAS